MLRILLYLGSIYFTLMSIAHLIGIKIAGLFIYFNVPSNTYQDKIISLLVFGWSIIFFNAAKSNSKQLTKSILAMGAIAILVLTYINISTDFLSLSPNTTPIIYHIEVGVLLLYLIVLFIGYKREDFNVG